MVKGHRRKSFRYIGEWVCRGKMLALIKNSVHPCFHFPGAEREVPSREKALDGNKNFHV